MTEATEVTTVVTASLDVLRAPDIRARDRMTVIARRWSAAGVAKSRSPAVWAAKRAILTSLITEIKAEHAEQALS